MARRSGRIKMLDISDDISEAQMNDELDHCFDNFPTPVKNTFPTPMKQAQYPQQGSRVEEIANNTQDCNVEYFDPISQKFVATGDVPKRRGTNHRFNRIKQEKQDEGFDFLPRTEGFSATGSTTARRLSGSSNGDTIAGDTSCIDMDGPKPKRLKKDGTAYLKKPHDRSQGLSMTPGAVDHRERKTTAKQYQDRLAELLPNDIVAEVESEGGITPLGRLFKAAVRTLERNLQIYAATSDDSDESVLSNSSTNTRHTRASSTHSCDAQEKLVRLQEQMRSILDSTK